MAKLKDIYNNDHGCEYLWYRTEIVIFKTLFHNFNYTIRLRESDNLFGSTQTCPVVTRADCSNTTACCRLNTALLQDTNCVEV